MSKKTLLLNSTYEPMRFITLRKALKLIVKNKVDILSDWGSYIRYGSGQFDHPATVRLKYYVPRHIKKRRYNRTGVFRRDKYICQYCSERGTASQLTIDHVKPKRMGGETTWGNCVTCCFECNNKKADRTPKMAKMKLFKKPTVPILTMWNEFITLSNPHDDWRLYIVGK